MKTFEKNLEKLNDLAEKIESPDTSLESAIKAYKEGLSLAEKCGEALRKCEEEVLTLKQAAEGIFELEPFTTERI